MLTIQTPENIEHKLLTNADPTADSILHTLQIPLSQDVIKNIQENFYMYSRSSQETNTESYQQILLSLINHMLAYIFLGKFSDIEQQRGYRKQEFEKLIRDNHKIISKDASDANIQDRQHMIQEITTLLYRENVLSSVPLTQFFGVPVLEPEQFVESDIYYYKGTSINILLLRQIVCDNHQHFDESTDHFGQDYKTGLAYAYGHRRFYNPRNPGHILCINKERLHSHLETIKHNPLYKNKKEEASRIHQIYNEDDHYLYHTIVPISCVDYIIKVPSK